MAATDTSWDKLGLVGNSDLMSMITAEGSATEELRWTEKVVKINRKDKRQDRALIMTNRAIYNCKLKSYKKSQRRIDIADVGMVTLSTESPEFVIHVPSSYDYHLVSQDSKALATRIAEIYTELTRGELYIANTPEKHLAPFVLTKKLAAYEAIDSKHVAAKSMKDVVDEDEE